MGLGLLIRVVGGFPFSLSEDLTVLGLAVVCGSLFLLLLVLLEEVELGFLCIWEGVGLLPTSLVVEGCPRNFSEGFTACNLAVF